MKKITPINLARHWVRLNLHLLYFTKNEPEIKMKEVATCEIKSKKNIKVEKLHYRHAIEKL